MATVPLQVRAAAELELRRRRRVRVGAVSRDLPPWWSDFERPARYKVAVGGRGSGKSWTFARKLLLLAAERPLRILCARELQVSIRDSVHRLLSDQVDALGLADVFEVGQSYIRGRGARNAGADFIFKGLRHNAAEIKSMEGIDICWVEEAQAVSERSWNLLIPTIRSPGSEIWITFNPDQESDPTYQRFVANPPADSIVREVNFDVNPWFPPDLEKERAHMARTDPDAYAHIWLGKFQVHSHSQVLKGKWVVDVFDPQPHWMGPYFGADWGFAEDPTVLVKCWIDRRTLYVEHEAYGVEVALDDIPQMFALVPDADMHDIMADCSRPETINHLGNHGWERVRAAPKWPGSVEDGVEFLRSFERIVIHERCRHTADEARMWRYKTDPLTEQVLPVLVKGNDHTWDAARYALSYIIKGRKSAFWLPESAPPTAIDPLAAIQSAVQAARQIGAAGTCGACNHFADGHCTERQFAVREGAPGCEWYRGG